MGALVRCVCSPLRTQSGGACPDRYPDKFWTRLTEDKKAALSGQEQGLCRSVGKVDSVFGVPNHC